MYCQKIKIATLIGKRIDYRLKRHKQLQREKKMKLKERKKTTLPKKHTKGRK
jgi:hypothetical protein